MGARERGDRIDPVEESRASGYTACLRCGDAGLWCLARGSRHRAEQGDPAVFGVCGNWITKNRRKKEAVYRSSSHAFDG